MKTTQIMQRDFLGGTVRQNHKNGMFCVLDLEAIGNQERRLMDLKNKQATHYFKTQSAIEHVEQVSIETGIDKDLLIIRKKGRNGGTWVHPLIFLDIAMWFNPRFKVKVFKWLMDELLLQRDCSGSSFKEMNMSLDSAFPVAMSMPYMYPKISNEVAGACGIHTKSKDRWNCASESQLRLRDQIQKNIIFASKMCPDLATTLKMAIMEARA